MSSSAKLDIELLTNGYIRRIQKAIGPIIPCAINAVISIFYPQLIWMDSKHYTITTEGHDPMIIQSHFRDETGKNSNSDFNSCNIPLNTFFNSVNKEIITITIEMTEIFGAFQALGFCTPEFEKWATDFGWNDGRNHSTLLYQNGYAPSSKEFQHPTAKGRWAQDQHKSMWRSGDTVIVEMDMNEQKGKIWNENQPDSIYVIELPNECTFILLLGNRSQTVTIKDIQHQQMR